MLDKERVNSILKKYPLLAIVLKAGLLNRKTLVGTLDLDIWLADDLCNSLVLAGAIEFKSNRNFTATKDMLEYLKEEYSYGNK